MNKARYFLLIILLICFLLPYGITATINQSSETEETIRIPLTRNDNYINAIFMSLTFDEERVKEILEKHQVKLPEERPSSSRIGYASSDETVVMLHKIPNKDVIILTMDANRNYDLSDDEAVEVPKRIGRDDGVIIKIKRTYEGPPAKEVWLPYRFSYYTRQNRQGESEDTVLQIANYRMEGNFQVNGKDYYFQLHDFNTKGIFDRSNLSRGTVVRAGPVSEGEKMDDHYWGYELIPMENDFYEISDFALDGSWLELKKSQLPRALLGKTAPDFPMTDTEGKAFRLSDFKGRVVLLDFWASWCKPCIEKFPDIKKMIEQYPPDELTVIGINVDTLRRIEQAKKVVADYEIPWQQVMEGKGYFLPIYQVFGLLPERKMTFPVYIVIDTAGIVRYATNDYQKVERILNKLLIASSEGKDALLIPLSRSYAVEEKLNPPVPIDFSPNKLKELMKSKEVKLTENMGKESRIGMMPNGTIIIAQAAADPEKILLTVDSTRDYDLTNDQSEEIPVVEEWKSDKDPCTEITLTIDRSSGGKSFYTFRFFARKQEEPSEDKLPGIYYYVRSMRYRGSFFHEDQEYAIILTDPTSDGIITPEDLKNPKILELMEKKGEEWLPVYTGMEKLPIGGAHFRVTDVCPDADWVELVKIR